MLVVEKETLATVNGGYERKEEVINYLFFCSVSAHLPWNTTAFPQQTDRRPNSICNFDDLGASRAFALLCSYWLCPNPSIFRAFSPFARGCSDIHSIPLRSPKIEWKLNAADGVDGPRICKRYRRPAVTANISSLSKLPYIINIFHSLAHSCMSRRSLDIIQTRLKIQMCGAQQQEHQWQPYNKNNNNN